MMAFAAATQAAQRQQDRRQVEEAHFRKANKAAPTLETVSPPETVFDFFNQFEVTVLTNRWSDHRARLELRGAMKGAVAQTVRSIPVGHDLPFARPWQELANQYLNAIITPEAMAGLKTQTKLMRQKEKESLSAWKARLVTAYNYAYR